LTRSLITAERRINLVCSEMAMMSLRVIRVAYDVLFAQLGDNRRFAQRVMLRRAKLLHRRVIPTNILNYIGWRILIRYNRFAQNALERCHV
jgi:hypothetical protein